MQLAVFHYERLTGRGAYGLAGYHYSCPEWGFQYHPGGEQIHRWTTIVPSYTTFALLAISLISAITKRRKAGWRALAGITTVHLLTSVAFAVVAAGFEFEVTGVFI
jgi:hypothetical protein